MSACVPDRPQKLHITLDLLPLDFLAIMIFLLITRNIFFQIIILVEIPRQGKFFTALKI
jgi:hypothetical protein